MSSLLLGKLILLAVVAAQSQTATDGASAGVSSTIQVSTITSLSKKDASINEMLVPANSTTALICEPIFNENVAEKTATWFKNGEPVAKVTSHSNAILGNRSVKFEGPIPQVGFLIVTNIQVGDEGDYWCTRDDMPQQRSDRSRLVVAFIEPLAEARLTYKIKEATADVLASLELICPETRALPKPTISWLNNDEPLDFSSGHYEVAANRLIIRRFNEHDDAGVYECVLSNFAGRTSDRVNISAATVGATTGNIAGIVPQARPRTKSASATCVGYFRNEILWFLIGCLSTSCIVLLYLISGMIFFKCSKRGRRQRYHNGLPQHFTASADTRPDETCRHVGRFAALRRFFDATIDANRLPGFCKVVAPAPPTARLMLHSPLIVTPTDGLRQPSHAINVRPSIKLAHTENRSDISNAERLGNVYCSTVVS